MRILFVQTNTNEYLNPFPLGAALVASRLRRDRHQVAFVDLMGVKDPAGVAAQAARRHAPHLACFSLRNRDNMSASAYADAAPGICAIVRAVREAAPCPSLLGGTAFSTYPSRWLEATGAEWGLCGDDLEAPARFVRSLEAGAPDLATPGLVRKEGSRVVENPYRLAGYADVRFDILDLVDLARYRRGFWHAGVVTRSGCPEACTYCDTFHTFGKQFALRPPEVVADELVALKRARAQSAFLVDAGFNRPLDHAKQVLRAILRKGAQLRLYAIHDPGAGDAEYFRLFRRAGGAMLVIFAESLSDPVLSALGKPFGAADVEKDIAAMREEGVGSLFMPTFGGPGETKQTVEETLGRAARLGASVMDFSIGWRIQPRTALRERAVEEGVIAAGDDCWEARFYVSKETPRPWLEQRIAAFKRAHPFLGLRILPFVARMAFDRPWRRGPEAVA